MKIVKALDVIHMYASVKLTIITIACLAWSW
jgi:hypothetical protein